MANEYYLDHVAFIIGQGEGTVQKTGDTWRIVYDAVELGEPNEGIGLLQWSMGRSFDILREIYEALGNNFGGTTPPTDIANAIVNNQRWTSHKWYQHNPDTQWVRQFLNLDTAKQIATQAKVQQVQELITKINSQGVTDLRAAGFGADVGNQYGTGWGKNFGMARYNSSHNSLDTIFNATPMTYGSRRRNCYNYLKSANFDNPPPVTYSIVDIDSEGPQEPPRPIGDDEGTMAQYIKNVLGAYVYSSGNGYQNSWLYLDKILDNAYKPSITLNFSKINWDDFQYFINGIKEKENNKKNENADNEIGNVGSDAIQRIINKANSYEDHSVPYSMSIRDMIKGGDCSSFVDICFREVNVNIGGYTGAQYNTAKSLGKIVIEGGRSQIPSIINNSQTGDVLLMAKNDPTFGAGGASHVGLIVSNGRMRHQASSYPDGARKMGPGTDDLTYYLNNWVSGYQSFALCRFL